MVKCGIVGLPNVGKSTLFNALCARRLAKTAAHPFTTIEPHEAVVEVPDEKLQKLADLIKPEKVVWATVTFIDIAGLCKGAAQGEGLGNQFLAKIREVDAILHVVRMFEDPTVVQISGKIDPKEDIDIVQTELELGGIKDKPTLYVYNVSEENFNPNENKLVINARLEEELIDLSPDERLEYLKTLGIEETGLGRLVKASYKLLTLVTFYTIKGGRQVHGWSLKSGQTAQDAAGIVHTDFAKKFIRAQVIEYDKLIEAQSWREAKTKGWIRTEGKDYIVKDGDVVEFLVGS